MSNAMFIPAPDVLQVELVYLWDSQVVQNVLHFKKVTPPVVLEDLDEVAAHVVTWWTGNMRDQMPGNLSLTSLKVLDLSSQTAPVIEYSTGLPSVGTNVSPSLPNNCALVLTKRTIKRGRSYRGRIYHPGLVEADVTGSIVSAVRTATLLQRYGLLLAFSTTGASWNMCVVSRFSNNVPRVEADSTIVLSLTSDGRVDSQRRRLPGRGA